MSQRKAILKPQSAAIDKAIHRLLYELYGLTAEEIRLVEEEKS